MFECKTCDVRWKGDSPCWSCDQSGVQMDPYQGEGFRGAATWRTTLVQND